MNKKLRCPKCNDIKKPTNIYCKPCMTKYRREYDKHKSELKSLIDNNDIDIIKFIDKIERRDGICSLEEIFVDMITYYQILDIRKNIDDLLVGFQLEYKLSHLKKRYKQIKLLSKEVI